MKAQSPGEMDSGSLDSVEFAEQEHAPGPEMTSPRSDRQAQHPPSSREALELRKLQRENRKLRIEAEKLALDKDGVKRLSRNLELQRLQLKNQYFRERLRALLDISLALLAVFVAAVLVHEIWSAWKEQAVVISPFQVAPAFEAQGSNGTVVASELLDGLEALQAATRASQAKRSVRDAWSNQLQIQIPEAKITIADFQKYLRDLLGNPVHIGGSLIQVKDEQGRDRIALTVRGSGFPAKSFHGAPGELTQLIHNAAEYVYGKSEPYLFGVYLATHGRMEEAVILAKENFTTVLPSDKPLLLNLWGNYLLAKSDNRGGIEKFRQAIALQPDFWIAYVNIQAAQMSMGEEEAAFQTGLEFERRAHRGSWWYPLLPDRFAPKVNPAWWMNVDGQRMDFVRTHAERVEDIKVNGPGGTTTTPQAAVDAQDLVGLHDLQAAELELQTSPGAGTDSYVIAQSLLVRALADIDLENYPGAAAKLQEMQKMLEKDADLQSNFTGISCQLALANELSGHPEHVDADIEKGGSLVDCYRAKADVDDHRGMWAQAQKDYARAVALAPSLPSAYEGWGEALARHGDHDGAMQKFAVAHERGPNWADPLEHWGEALAAKGLHREAIEKYGEAARIAPTWGALYLHWGISLEKLGKHSDAMDKWHRAQSLPLGDRNRKILNQLTGWAGVQEP